MWPDKKIRCMYLSKSKTKWGYILITAKRVRSQVVRNCRSLDDRRREYRRHAMQDDSDDFLMEREDSDEIFTPRNDHPRHERHSRSSKSSRRSSGKMDRSLRPLKNKCYVDPRSSITNSNSSGDEKPETDCKCGNSVYFFIIVLFSWSNHAKVRVAM